MAHVLVVEDDQDLHIGLALRLQSAGHSVASALDGLDVTEIAIRECPDVVLLDVGLPGRSGHEVARELAQRRETRNIPIIFLTARHEPSHRVKASLTGAAAYLVKPAKPDTLLAAIDAAIGSRAEPEPDGGLAEAA